MRNLFKFYLKLVFNVLLFVIHSGYFSEAQILEESPNGSFETLITKPWMSFEFNSSNVSGGNL